MILLYDKSELVGLPWLSHSKVRHGHRYMGASVCVCVKVVVECFVSYAPEQTRQAKAGALSGSFCAICLVFICLVLFLRTWL